MKKKLTSLLLSLGLTLAMLCSLAVPSFAAGDLYAGGSGTKADPWHIKTVEQLQNVKENLDGNFVLDNDLDLSSVANWEPLGGYAELGETEFTGTFNGKNHQISNLTIASVKLIGGGLFGFISDGGIVKNLKLRDFNIKGCMFAGCLAAMAEGDGYVKNITLTGNNNISGIMYIGGILGAAECRAVKNLTATANVSMQGVPVLSQAAGVVIGAVEGPSLINCHAKGGTVNVNGSATVKSSGAVGAMAGLASESKEVRNCSAENVTVTVRRCSMVGGLLGHAGTTKGIENVSKRTKISGCTVKNVKIKADSNCSRIGGLLGSGYYRPLFQSEVNEPAAYYVTNCSVNARISTAGNTDEMLIGAVAGYAGHNSAVANTKANVKLNGAKMTKLIGATIDEVPADQLW